MTTQKANQLYEGMYIISAQLSEDARNKAVEKIKAGIEGHGGSVKKVHDWGRRRLAYQIEGHREGYYFILYFECPAKAIEELWHEYHLNEDLVRFITLQADKVCEEITFKALAEQ